MVKITCNNLNTNKKRHPLTAVEVPLLNSESKNDYLIDEAAADVRFEVVDTSPISAC